MNHIYHTNGIILSGLNFSEANKYLFIFTEKLGLIKIAAQGLRNLKSKLRYGLQDFSLVQLSVVRGKGVWRVTNAVYIHNFYFSLSAKKEKLVLTSRLLFLLKQLLAGEEKNENLYLVIIKAFSFLEKEIFSAEDIKSFENIIMVRILHCLGYFDKRKKINDEKLYASFLNLTEWNKNLLDKMSGDEIRRQTIFDINESLRSSHLV